VTVVEVGEILESVLVHQLGTPGDPLRPVDMAAQLPAAYQRVDSVAGVTEVAGFLVVVGPEPDQVAELPVPVRRRLVAVTDVDAEAASRWLAEQDLLGLVTSFTWTRWAHGMMGASQVFGRADVAGAAGLTQRAGTGALTGQGKPLELPDLLARYLAAAGRVVPE
jgi:hypothetical protein